MLIRLAHKPARGWTDEEPQICDRSIGCVRAPTVFWGGSRRQR
jgi:hypothetical protein